MMSYLFPNKSLGFALGKYLVSDYLTIDPLEE